MDEAILFFCFNYNIFNDNIFIFFAFIQIFSSFFRPSSSRLFKAAKENADQHTERSRNRESLLSSN